MKEKAKKNLMRAIYALALLYGLCVLATVTGDTSLLHAATTMGMLCIALAYMILDARMLWRIVQEADIRRMRTGKIASHLCLCAANLTLSVGMASILHNPYMGVVDTVTLVSFVFFLLLSVQLATARMRKKEKERNLLV